MQTKEEKREYSKKHYNENKEKINKRNKKWRKENSEKIKEASKKYRLENLEKEKIRGKKWRKENPEYFKKYHQENEEKNKKYIEKNKGKIKLRRQQYHKNKMEIDPTYRLNGAMASSIGKSLKGNKNGAHWEDIVGYTLQNLMEYLEAQFEPWMNWKNHGRYVLGGRNKWHIDHIIPQSSFKFEFYTDPEFKKCWALSNLRPLDALTNIKKSNKSMNWITENI